MCLISSASHWSCLPHLGFIHCGFQVIATVFFKVTVYHSANMCLERNILVKDPYFALKTIPAYLPQSFVSCGSKCMRTFFLVLYLVTLSVSSLV